MKYLFFMFSLLGLSFLMSCSKSGEKNDQKSELPSAAFPEVAVKGRLNILDFGVIGDGKTDNTVLLQQAINECSAKAATVVFPKGIYYTRPLLLKSNVTLELGEGAVILGSPNKADYDKVFPNATSIETSALLYGNEVSNVKITGKGQINGQGGSPDFKLGNGADGRPKLVFFVRSKNISLENVQLINSAFWTAHFLTCDTVKIKGVNVNGHSNWNNDGLDIDAKNVEVSDCYIDCDDDGLCFKSDRSVICENITVTNCTIKSNCNAIKFGTASKSGFKNINISNCKISKASEENFRHWKTSFHWAGILKDTTVLSGIALESVDGGILDGINISRIEMEDVQTPIFIRLGDRNRAYSANVSVLKNVSISEVTAKAESKIACSITGVPGGIVENILIKNIHLTLPGGGTASDANAVVPENEKIYPENRMFGIVLSAYGFYVRHAKNIRFDNVKIDILLPDARPEYKFDDVDGYAIN